MDVILHACNGKWLMFHFTSFREIRVYKESWNCTSWSKKWCNSSHLLNVFVKLFLLINLNKGLIWIILSLISVIRTRYYCWKTHSINFKIWLVKVCYRWRHMYDQCIYATVGYLMRRSDTHKTFSVHSWFKYCVKDTNCQYFRWDHGNEVKWLAAKGAKFIWNGSTLALF